MILVIGGTSDSREIAKRLAESSASVMISTATEYGALLAAESGVAVSTGRLTAEQLKSFLVEKKISVLVDASHPYATEVTLNAAAACTHLGIPYIRYSRPGEPFPLSPSIELVNDYLEAARRACESGGIIIAATGGKTAPIFMKEAAGKGRRIIFRVMPDPGVISMLQNLGAGPADIAAMQGPFSEEMNIAMIRHYNAQVMVTKESGKAGGFLEKVTAAEKTGIRLIVIRRPPEPEGAVSTVEEAVRLAIGFVIN